MKNPIKALRTLAVTAYANRIYRQTAKAAEERWKNEKTMIYVVTPRTNLGTMELLSAEQFRKLKYRTGMDQNENKLSKLKATCWYHTADRHGEDKLPERDKEIRRLAFVRWTLSRAGICD